MYERKSLNQRRAYSTFSVTLAPLTNTEDCKVWDTFSTMVSAKSFDQVYQNFQNDRSLFIPERDGRNPDNWKLLSIKEVDSGITVLEE